MPDTSGVAYLRYESSVGSPESDKLSGLTTSFTRWTHASNNDTALLYRLPPMHRGLPNHTAQGTQFPGAVPSFNQRTRTQLRFSSNNIDKIIIKTRLPSTPPPPQNTHNAGRHPVLTCTLCPFPERYLYAPTKYSAFTYLVLLTIYFFIRLTCCDAMHTRCDCFINRLLDM